VFAGGFGVRELGKPAKVDADTKFLIASNTKAMTTLMLAKLVDEKKLTWETPATQLLPSFKLGDADTTRRVLVKHLICACTGLPRQDFEWLLEYKGVTPEGALRTLATMKPTSKFGEMFQYSNLLAGAAGFAGGHVLYPNLGYFTDAPVFYPGNTVDIQPNLSASPVAALTVQTGCDFIRRLETTDAVYEPPGIPLVRGVGTGNHAAATLCFGKAIWRLTPNLELTGAYVRARPKSVVRDAGGTATDYWLAQFSLKL
jgi:hypothetical protein